MVGWLPFGGRRAEPSVAQESPAKRVRVDAESVASAPAATSPSAPESDTPVLQDPSDPSTEGKPSAAANDGLFGRWIPWYAQSKSPPAAPNGAAASSSEPASAASTPTAERPTPTQSKESLSGPRAPNMVLPSFSDTFEHAPRSWPQRVGIWDRTCSAINTLFFQTPPDNVEQLNRSQKPAGPAELQPSGSGAAAPHLHAEHEQSMPRTHLVAGDRRLWKCRGCEGVRRIVVIGVHGWFAQSILKSVLGTPTGTSIRFATMMAESIQRHFRDAGLELNAESVTIIAPQHDGTVQKRTNLFYDDIVQNQEYVAALHDADAVFVAAHSQGSIVASLLLSRLIEEGFVNPVHSQLCLLTLCGIFHGPFAHLKSSITTSYVNWFETAAARELFEFQSSESEVAQQHTEAYRKLLKAGAKYVHIGSIDDNVVPLYSAIYAGASHPSILRALYIDGSAFPKADFLINLLVLCVAVRNGGFHDHNLLTLLSASVAGSLFGGLGHSLVYDEPAVYDLATRYLFETSSPGVSGAARVPLVSQQFVVQYWNPYEIPWNLRGLLEDDKIRRFYAESIAIVLHDFGHWTPLSKPLKNLQWRLSPLRTVRMPRTRFGHSHERRARDAAGLVSASPDESDDGAGLYDATPKL